MRCTSCGTRAEPENDVFSCPYCGYSQQMPRTWELTGQMDYSVYRPGAVFTQPTADEIAAEEEHIRSCTHTEKLEKGERPKHPGRLSDDDPRKIAWCAKQRAAQLGRKRGVRA